MIANNELLETPLCTVRRWVHSDISALPSIANDASVVRYLRHTFPNPYTQNDAAEWVKFSLGQRDEQTSFAIVVNGELAGSIGIKPGADIYSGSAEVGYWLGRTFHRQGIATSALMAITKHSFATSSIHRLWAGVMAPNARSMNVLERAGYVREAVLKSALTTRAGNIVDEVLYSQLREPMREE